MALPPAACNKREHAQACALTLTYTHLRTLHVRERGQLLFMALPPAA